MGHKMTHSIAISAGGVGDPHQNEHGNHVAAYNGLSFSQVVGSIKQLFLPIRNGHSCERLLPPIEVQEQRK